MNDDIQANFQNYSEIVRTPASVYNALSRQLHILEMRIKALEEQLRAKG